MRPGRVAITVVLVTMVAVALVIALRPGWYVRLFHPLRYPNYIVTHATNHDLPPDLVAAVIYQESRFNERARSHAGALGLMQITPATARGIAQRTGGTRFETGDLYDPEINIRYGSWYLDHLRDKYRLRGSGGDPYDLALAAYNAGQGKVDRWIRAEPDKHLSVNEIPYGETRTYVRNVQRLRADYRRAWNRSLQRTQRSDE
jgi:soluble lytic murein transglycosylase